MIIETATLHARTCTRSRVKTYSLDSSSVIYGTMDVEERVEHHSDPWSNVCGRKGRVPQ